VAPTETLEEEEPIEAPTPTPQEEEPTEQPASIEGESLLQERCTVCHSLSRVMQAQKTREKWEQTAARMVGKGAQLNAGEQATLIEYLAETYGP
jgi:cytochrome c5